MACVCCIKGTTVPDQESAQGEVNQGGHGQATTPGANDTCIQTSTVDREHPPHTYNHLQLGVTTTGHRAQAVTWKPGSYKKAACIHPTTSLLKHLPTRPPVDMLLEDLTVKKLGEKKNYIVRAV